MPWISPLPSIDIPDVPLSAFVLEHAPRLGDKPAVIDGTTGEVLAYAQLRDRAHRLAGGLSASGFGRGDVLAIMAPNCPDYAIAFHGASLAGGIVTTINPAYTEEEVRSQLRDSGATILVVDEAARDTAAAASEGTSISRTYVMGDPGPFASLAKLEGEPIAPVAVAPDDVVALPYSSGTTGLSKGVMLTHRNLVANVAQVASAARFREDETFIAVLPFFHIYGMQVLVNTAMRAGATIVTMPRFDLEQFLRLHQEHRITRSFVAPPIVIALAKHPIVDQFDLSALEQVFSGAAPLSAELALEASARLGCEVVQGYGMTEMSPVSHLTTPGGFKPGSVGVTAPETETKIVDPETQREVELGEDGEICVRGPQVMLGYLGRPEATAEILDADGWLHTGDVGHIDVDGHLFVVDRLKELIKVSGFQVPPAELEALLLTHPGIADAAVVAIPDQKTGEVPAAFVVLRPGAEITGDEVMTFVADHVAHYKQVRHVTFVDTIPKSASGKILRRELRG